MDITLWESIGRGTRKFKIGQYVLLDQLVTSDRHERNNKRVWYMNGSAICGTKIYNSKVATTHTNQEIIILI